MRVPVAGAGAGPVTRVGDGGTETEQGEKALTLLSTQQTFHTMPLLFGYAFILRICNC